MATHTITAKDFSGYRTEVSLASISGEKSLSMVSRFNLEGTTVFVQFVVRNYSTHHLLNGGDSINLVTGDFAQAIERYNTL